MELRSFFVVDALEAQLDVHLICNQEAFGSRPERGTHSLVV